MSYYLIKWAKIHSVDQRARAKHYNLRKLESVDAWIYMFISHGMLSNIRVETDNDV